MSPVATRSLLAARSRTPACKVASSHSWTRLDDPDSFDRASAAVAELGSSSIILSGGGSPPWTWSMRFADRLNAASASPRGTGCRWATTTMRRDAALDGIPLYRRLLHRLDPAVVFQVDIFWVVVGGPIRRS